VVYEPEPLSELPDDRLLERLSQARALRMRWQVEDPEEDVFVNVLRPAGSKALACHILNCTMRDHHHATILDHPQCVARKRIVLSEQQRRELDRPVVSLLGFTPYWTQTYMAREILGQPFRHKLHTKASVVVRVNGAEAGRLPLGQIQEGWTHVEFDRALLREENTVEVSVTGDVGQRRSYYGLLIDTAAPAGDSQWVPAPWPEERPESPDDLSPYAGVQSGSFLIAIHNADQSGELPTYAPRHTPVADLTISLPWPQGGEPAAVLLSPDTEEPLAPELTRTAEGLAVSVPPVDVYGVLVIAPTGEQLEALLRAAQE